MIYCGLNILQFKEVSLSKGSDTKTLLIKLKINWLKQLKINLLALNYNPNYIKIIDFIFNFNRLFTTKSKY